MPKTRNIRGKLHTLCLLSVDETDGMGRPRKLTLVGEAETVDVKERGEFVTAWIPTINSTSDDEGNGAATNGRARAEDEGCVGPHTTCARRRALEHDQGGGWCDTCSGLHTLTPSCFRGWGSHA